MVCRGGALYTVQGTKRLMLVLRKDVTEQV
ncbi:hypothetical protein BH23GEM10_BH23GEM10_14350 [soil metagenome]